TGDLLVPNEARYQAALQPDAYPWDESNVHPRLRRPVLSPLSYRGAEGEGIEPPPVPPGQRLSKPSHYRSGNLPCAAPTGLEPASPALTRQCSTIELRHPVYCVPGEGFEPPSFRLWTGRLFRWASR